MQSSSRVSPCTTFVLVLIVSMIVFFFIFLPITQTKSWLLTTQRKLVNIGSESDTTTRMSMGSKKDCDDGKSNLTMDLGDMEEATTCYTGHRSEKIYPKNDRIVFLRNNKEHNKEVCMMPSADYTPEHACMASKIDYSQTTWGSPVPTHGTHRPVWASFGRYRYLPPERWQHNLEHGVVVLLYHPCLNADPRGRKQLTRLIHTVRRCIRKHVVTPSRRWTTLDNPVTLVAWGCSLSLSSSSHSKVRDFIKSHGLQAPEGNYTKDGEYNLHQVM